MLHVDLENGEYLVIKGQGESDRPDNARRIKEWGVPGSKVKERVTEKADAKAAEDKELFMALAHFFYRTIPVKYLSDNNNPKYRLVRDWMNDQARRYGFSEYSEALKYLEARDRENETK